MNKSCAYCGDTFKDGDEVKFVADGNFRLIPSKVNFALDKDFVIEDLYHAICGAYVLGGGK